MSEFVLHPACNDGCVVTAIANYTEQLRSNHSYIPADVKQSSLLGGYYVSEPTPLEFVVHFVADVHQPLHVAHQQMFANFLSLFVCSVTRCSFGC